MTFSISSLSSVFVYSSSVTLLGMNPDSSDGAPPKGEIQSESGFRHNKWEAHRAVILKDCTKQSELNYYKDAKI